MQMHLNHYIVTPPFASIVFIRTNWYFLSPMSTPKPNHHRNHLRIQKRIIAMLNNFWEHKWYVGNHRRRNVA